MIIISIGRGLIHVLLSNLSVESFWSPMCFRWAFLFLLSFLHYCMDFNGVFSILFGISLSFFSTIAFSIFSIASLSFCSLFLLFWYVLLFFHFSSDFNG